MIVKIILKMKETYNYFTLHLNNYTFLYFFFVIKKYKKVESKFLLKFIVDNFI